VVATTLENLAESLGAPSDAAGELLANHLLDTLGAWYAGRRTPDAALLRELAGGTRASPPALGDDPLDRIALRVAIIRNTEIDDIHMGSCTTPGSVVVPVALSLAAALGVTSASRFAQSLAMGYEAMIRLSLAVSGATILYRGVWPTFLTGPMGAAAAAAPLLGLDAGATADAMALALNLSSGAAGGHGGPSPRWILLGQAARAGVFAALAVARGYGADRTLLDGDWLQRTHGIACDPARLLAPVAAEGAIAAVSYKPYCSAKQGMAAIDGFLALLRETKPGDIAAVRVAVPPSYAGMIGHRNAAQGRVERITSTAYLLALAAYRPDLLDDVVRPDLTAVPEIAAFMSRVEVASDPDLAPHFPERYPARVEITLADGRKREQLVTDALGDPARSLDEPALRAKFRRLADPEIGAEVAERLASSALAATRDDAALAALAGAFATAERPR
jgi:2-methylcitrate dehydratase PrpD